MLNRRSFLSSVASATIVLSTPKTFAQPRGSDLFILIPGIAGSTLSVRGRDVWAPSIGGVGRALLSLGRSLDALTLGSDDPNATALGDGVTANGLVRDVHLIPGLWKIDGYSQISSMLMQTEGLRPGRNYFEFPYDWRRDNRVAARRLAKLSGEWLRSWRATSGNDSARIVLLAHSMGGLISRYFLECLEGWRDSRLLITFGTPYRGSLNALSTLANGIELGKGPIEFANLSPLFRSFTSVYQLLPTYPCIESPDGRLLRVGEISLDRIDAARVTAAQRFHDEIREAQSANQKREDYQRNGYAILPIVGTSQATTQGATLVGRGLQFSQLLKGQSIDGDGTVPAPSAVPLELSGKQRELFVSKAHSSLQSSKEVLTQIAGTIRAGQIDWGAFRSRGGPKLGLSLRGAYSTGEAIRLSGTYSGAVGRPQVSARVDDAYSGKIVIARRVLQAKNGAYDADTGKLPAGTYRVVVELVDTGGLDSRTVEDVCVVLGA